MRPVPREVFVQSLRRGDYLAALAQVDHVRLPASQLDLARAELFKSTGRASDAIRIIRERLGSAALAKNEIVAALRIEGEALGALGNVSDALSILDQAAFEAEACGALEDAALAALSRFTLLANSRGMVESQPALELARRAVLRSGGTQLLASLYARVGQAHAQRGLAGAALQYLQNALDLLSRDEHYGIRAFSTLALSGAEFLLARYRVARSWARQALIASEAGGVSHLQAAAQANLALLEYRLGHYSAAKALCNGALSEPNLAPLTRGPILDTLALIALAEGRVDEVQDRLEDVAAIIAATDDVTFLSVDAAAASAAYWAHVADYERAELALTLGIERAEIRGDAVSAAKLALLRAEVRVERGNIGEAIEDMSKESATSQRPSAELVGLSCRVRGVLNCANDNWAEGRVEFGRAIRTFRRCGDRPNLVQTRLVWRTWRAAKQGAGQRTPTQRRQRMISRVASTLSFLGRLAPHPDILAREVCEALRRLAPSVQCSMRVVDSALDSWEEGHLTVGQIGSKRYELLLNESSATLADAEVLRATRIVVRGAVAAEKVVLTAMHSVLGSAVEEASEEGAVGIYASQLTKRLLQLAKQVADTDIPILILGETGTGKEVLAKEIHAFSRRADRPFIPFNVTAVSRDLLESQLFGARRGSFTGAVSDVKGLIREAEGGTVFLDEIGEMSLELQPKLLRFVEQHEVQPVGERPQRVDVRVIAATNASLRDLVKEGRFREDLFYRLNVVPLEIPPLRDRREEIPAFVRHFIAAHARDAKRPVPEVTPRALERLVAANWPGNVRQLNNELKRIVALLPEGESIELRHLSPDVLTPPATPPLAPVGPQARASVGLDRPLDQVVDDVERAAIERAMFLAHGNISEAARRLGVTRKGLYLKRRRLGLEPGP